MAQNNYILLLRKEKKCNFVFQPVNSIAVVIKYFKYQKFKVV